jgi:hypothetical protein
MIALRPRRKKRRKFRIALLAVPLAVFLAMWIGSGISIGFGWNEVMNKLHVHNKEAYSRLACLGLVAVAIVTVARIMRKEQKEED